MTRSSSRRTSGHNCPLRFREEGRFESGETQCPGVDGEDAETGQLRVVRWNNINDTGDGTTFIAGFDSVGLTEDAMAVVIAFVPDGETITMPPWVADFAENVQNDAGQLGVEELFPDVEVSEDGDVTVDSVPLEEEDVGPAVEEAPDPTEPDTDDAETDEDTDTSEADTTDADDG